MYSSSHINAKNNRNDFNYYNTFLHYDYYYKASDKSCNQSYLNVAM